MRAHLIPFAAALLASAAVHAGEFEVNPSECAYLPNPPGGVFGATFCPWGTLGSINTRSGFLEWSAKNKVLARLKAGETVIVPAEYIIPEPPSVPDATRPGKMIGEP